MAPSLERKETESSLTISSQHFAARQKKALEDSATTAKSIDDLLAKNLGPADLCSAVTDFAYEKEDHNLARIPEDAADIMLPTDDINEPALNATEAKYLIQALQPINFEDPEHIAALKLLCNFAATEEGKEALWQDEVFAEFYANIFANHNPQDLSDDAKHALAAGFSNIINCDAGQAWLNKNNNRETLKDALTGESKDWCNNTKNSDLLRSVTSALGLLNRTQPLTRDERAEPSPQVTKRLLDILVNVGETIQKNPADITATSKFLNTVSRFSYEEHDNVAYLREKGINKSIFAIAEKHSGDNIPLQIRVELSTSLVNLASNAENAKEYGENPVIQANLSNCLKLSNKDLQSSGTKDAKEISRLVHTISATAAAINNINRGKSVCATENVAYLLESLNTITDPKLKGIAPQDLEKAVGNIVIGISSYAAGERSAVLQDESTMQKIISSANLVNHDDGMHRYAFGLGSILNCPEGAAWLETSNNRETARNIMMDWSKKAQDPVAQSSIARALSIINREIVRDKPVVAEIASDAKVEAAKDNVVKPTIKTATEPTKPEENPAIAATSERKTVEKLEEKKPEEKTQTAETWVARKGFVRHVAGGEAAKWTNRANDTTGEKSREEMQKDYAKRDTQDPKSKTAETTIQGELDSNKLFSKKAAARRAQSSSSTRVI